MKELSWSEERTRVKVRPASSSIVRSLKESSHFLRRPLAKAAEGRRSLRLPYIHATFSSQAGAAAMATPEISTSCRGLRPHPQPKALSVPQAPPSSAGSSTSAPAAERPTAWWPRRSRTPRPSASTRPGSPSTTSTNTRAGCRRLRLPGPRGRAHAHSLGTGIVTLPLENALRVAEDAIVLDLLAGGRLELGVGTGSTPRPSPPSASMRPSARPCSRGSSRPCARPGPAGPRGRRHAATPRAPQLLGRIWQATFSVERRRARRPSRRRPDALAHPAAHLKHPMRRWPSCNGPDHRCLLWPRCRPAPATHRGIAQRLRGRHRAPRRCDWPRSACAARPRASRPRARQPRRPRGPRGRSDAADRGLRRARGHARGRDRLACRRQHARARHRPRVAVHSVDPPHAGDPALDRARRHRGRAGAGAGSATRLRPPPTFLPPDLIDRHHPTTVADVTDQLVGIAPGDPLDRLRAHRDRRASARSRVISRCSRRRRPCPRTSTSRTVSPSRPS